METKVPQKSPCMMIVVDVEHKEIAQSVTNDYFSSIECKVTY
jgi:hypothetical protein